MYIYTVYIYIYDWKVRVIYLELFDLFDVTPELQLILGRFLLMHLELLLEILVLLLLELKLLETRARNAKSRRR